MLVVVIPTPMVALGKVWIHHAPISQKVPGFIYQQLILGLSLTGKCATTASVFISVWRKVLKHKSKEHEGWLYPNLDFDNHIAPNINIDAPAF